MGLRLFASHDWGADGANHARVEAVVARLQSRGFRVWMDSSDMSGNIIDAMCRGIDGSDVVLVFVTCNYMAKVESGDAWDNVRREFMYAATTPAKLLPIRFDDRLPSVWSGPLGMMLGHDLYVNMPTDGGIEWLVDAIERRQPQAPHRPAPCLVRGNSYPGGSAIAKGGALVRGNTFSIPPVVAAESPVPKAELVVLGQGIKERTERVRARFGGPMPPTERSKDAIDRIFESVVGDQSMRALTFLQKLVLVEKNLGL